MQARHLIGRQPDQCAVVVHIKRCWRKGKRSRIRVAQCTRQWQCAQGGGCPQQLAALGLRGIPLITVETHADDRIEG